VAVASAGPYASLHLTPDKKPCQYYTTQSFLQAGCPSCHPTNSVKAQKAKISGPTGQETGNSGDILLSLIME